MRTCTDTGPRPTPTTAAHPPSPRARVRVAALAVALAVVAAGTLTRLDAHDLERTTVHLDVAADGGFTLRLAHDPSWLLLRMASFAGTSDVSPTDAAARDARLRVLAPSAIDRVVLFVEFADAAGAIVRHEVRPDTSAYTPPPAQVPEGEFALAAYTLRGRLPAGARSLRWYYGMVADPYPLTLTLPDGSTRTEWVQGDAWSTALPLGGTLTARTWPTRLREYLWLGYTHILPKGVDHLLFVAACSCSPPACGRCWCR